LLEGCSAGGGTAGSELLIELSKIWPGRRVVAFETTMAYGWDRGRKSEFCGEVGYRDTNSPDECYGDRESCERQRYQPDWNNLDKLPWGSEHSTHAKVVQDGKILKDPPDTPVQPAQPK
jgi:hypothetical protein